MVTNSESPLELSNSVINIIGFNCAERFNLFKNYPEGWGGEGKSLSPESINIFQKFILENESIIYEPSIFLTRRGNLQLGWDSPKYGYLEVEMFSTHIEYWIECIDTNGILLLSDISNFISILTHFH